MRFCPSYFLPSDQAAFVLRAAPRVYTQKPPSGFFTTRAFLPFARAAFATLVAAVLSFAHEDLVYVFPANFLVLVSFAGPDTFLRVLVLVVAILKNIE